MILSISPIYDLSQKYDDCVINSSRALIRVLSGLLLLLNEVQLDAAVGHRVADAGVPIGAPVAPQRRGRRPQEPRERRELRLGAVAGACLRRRDDTRVGELAVARRRAPRTSAAMLQVLAAAARQKRRDARAAASDLVVLEVGPVPTAAEATAAAAAAGAARASGGAATAGRSGWRTGTRRS